MKRPMNGKRTLELPHIPTLTVMVEQRHIDSAIPGVSTRCMIANALRERYPLDSVDVEGNRVRLNKGRLRYYYEMTGLVAVALDEWDEWARENEERRRMGLAPLPCPTRPFKIKLDGRRATVREVQPTGPRSKTRAIAVRTHKPSQVRWTTRRRHGLRTARRTG